MAENNEKKKLTKKQKEVLIGFGLIAAGAVAGAIIGLRMVKPVQTAPKDIPVVDVDDVLKFIVETTGVDMETARKVDEAELNYLIKRGIAD